MSMPGGGSAPIMSTGTDYWLSARTINGAGFYVWNRNDQSIQTVWVQDPTGGTSWNFVSSSGTAPAFRVNVAAAIPEPGPSSTMLLIGYAIFSRRNRLPRAHNV